MASRSNKQVRYAQPVMPSSAPKTSPRAGIMNSVRSAVTSQKPQSRMAPNFVQQTKFLPYKTGTDKSGNRLGPRPQVGEADPATRRKALDAALRPGPPVKAAPMKPKPAAPVDASGAGGRARSKKIDDLAASYQR